MKTLKTILYILVLPCMLIFSCNNEDEEVVTSEVQLLSFGPTGVKLGENIQFIGNNLNKVTEIVLQGATVSQSEFITQSPTLIEIKTPLSSQEGLVILKTSDGDITSKTILSFLVETVLTEYPEMAKPGETISLKGNYLNWVSGIRFARDTVVVDFLEQSITELKVTVPMNAQTGPLVLFGGGTDPKNITSERDLQITLPTFESFSPDSLEVESNLTISGKDLDLVWGINLNDEGEPITDFVSKTTTEIKVKTPVELKDGIVSLIAYSGVVVSSNDTLKVIKAKE